MGNSRGKLIKNKEKKMRNRGRYYNSQRKNKPKTRRILEATEGNKEATRERKGTGKGMRSLKWQDIPEKMRERGKGT